VEGTLAKHLLNESRSETTTTKTANWITSSKFFKSAKKFFSFLKAFFNWI
jgi:hypothetical protein